MSGPTGAGSLAPLEARLDGARLWGLEIETRYRVLAATFELDPADLPDGVPAGDPRLQVLFFPVGVVLASLRRSLDDGRTSVETFGEEHLLAVVASFEGARVGGRLFGQQAPAPGEWGPRFSMEGRAQVPDGRSHSVRFHLEGDGGRAFDLHASFDEVRVRAPDGNDLDPSVLR